MDIIDDTYNALVSRYNYLRQRIEVLTDAISKLKRSIDELEDMAQHMSKIPNALEQTIEYARKKTNQLQANGFSVKLANDIMAPMHSGTMYNNARSVMAHATRAVTSKHDDLSAEKQRKQTELNNAQYECSIKNAEINSYVPPAATK